MAEFFFWFPIVLYFTGWVVEFVRYWRLSDFGLYWGGGLLAVGWGAHTFLLGVRLAESGISLENLLSGAAWLAIVAYYFLVRRYKGTVFGFVFPPFAVATMLVAALSNEATLLGPGRVEFSAGMTQNLLATHIATVLAGHLLFGLACLLSIIYLWRGHQLKSKIQDLTESRIPSLGALEELNHKAIGLGFFFLSVGILLGMVVAGLYTFPVRGLSARQIMPALTWLFYAAFLIFHSLQGRRGRFGAIWSISGFLVVTSALAFELFVISSRG